ncbi:outer dense fiber protein 3-like [Physella acuta]|uniref:outer dense fiber protein 3-like n=1 Tax=Physella acuta TaxID=109671 RepID=UPI0027DCF286|nr:outer dense fiber protein 3-like [Physella acuta]XP_059141491.1 outer dense fiber protein 3-like [Physella acuta]
MTAEVQTKDVGGWVPTRPRGPIAAMYNSPGPCYGLPTLVGQPGHDFRSVHPKKPAWVFGIRHGKFQDDCSPGPCYLPKEKYYRDGPDGTPHYSLHDRHKDLTSFKTPGPGAYKPESAGPNAFKSAPKYSFGLRNRNRKCDNTPGPNNYTLPGMLGKTTESHKKSAPNYSLVGRSKMGGFSEDLAKTPGPGAYNVTSPNIYKTAPPNFSMTSRNVMPGDGTQKPGPGAHSPERVYVTKRAAPAFTMGMRHTPYKAAMLDAPCDD